MNGGHIHRSGSLRPKGLVIAAVGLAAALACGVAASATAKAPYRAGLPIEFRSEASVSGCTSSFAVRTKRGWRGLTAGSCATRAGRQAVSLERGRDGRSRLGRVDHNAFRASSGRADWLSFTLPGRRVNREIRRPGLDLRVARSLPTNPPPPGTGVCFVGRLRGQVCGQIVDPSNPIVSDHCAQVERFTPGDAGAPIYLNTNGPRTKAVGIVTTHTVSPLDGLDYVCYQPLGPVLERAGGHLRLMP